MEAWKTVVGFGSYEVSDLGRVRSFKKKSEPGKILSPGWKGTKRYRAVQLTESGLSKSVKVHHLVLDAFVGPRPVGTEGCHRNGIHTDNRLVNLRWDTHKANMADVCWVFKPRNGRFLKPMDILSIRSSDRMAVVLAAEYGVSSACISKIRSRQIWKHV